MHTAPTDGVSHHFLMPGSDAALVQECARFRVAAGNPVRLKLQSISPGGELEDKNIRLEILPGEKK